MGVEVVGRCKKSQMKEAICLKRRIMDELAKAEGRVDGPDGRCSVVIAEMICASETRPSQSMESCGRELWVGCSSETLLLANEGSLGRRMWRKWRRDDATR